MSRAPFAFLRPYLSQATSSLRPEHARAYLSLHRHSIHTRAGSDYYGPHDVEKQKRLEQLSKVKPLEQYHPQLVNRTGAESLSLRDFNAKYHNLQETQPDLVSVLGMTNAPERHKWSDSARKGALSAVA